MSKYKRYKKDSTVERKVLQKYKLGGLLDKVKGIGKSTGELARNYGMGVADTGLAFVGAKDVITEDDYKGKGSKLLGGYSEFMGGIQEQAAPAIAGAFGGPQAAQAMSMIQQAGGQLNPQEELEQDSYRSDTSPVRALKMGGQTSDDLVEFNGNTHENGGIQLNNPNGEPVEVEGNETMRDDVIDSNSFKYNKYLLKGLKKEGINISDKYLGMTPAEAQKKEDSKYSTNDMFKENALKLEEKNGTGKFAITEGSKLIGDMINGSEQFKCGGNRKKFKGGGKWDKISKTAKQLNQDPAPNDAEDVTNIIEGVPEGFKVYKKDGKYLTWKPSTSDTRKRFNLAYGKATKANKETFMFEDKEYTTAMAPAQAEEYFIQRPKLTPVGVPQSKEYAPEAPIAEPNTPNYPEVPQQSIQDNMQLDPLTPNIWESVAKAAPGIASGIIGLNRKIDYEEVSPEQIRLQQLDPTRAVQEIRGQINANNENIRQTARGTGSYLSNRLAAQGTGQRGTSSIFADYDNRNVGIANRQQEINFNERTRVRDMNVGLRNRETDANYNRVTNAINNIQEGVGSGVDQYIQNRQAIDYANIMHPDYVPARTEEGDMTIAKRDWVFGNNFNNSNNIEESPEQSYGTPNYNMPSFKSNIEASEGLDFELYDNAPENVRYNQGMAKYGGRISKYRKIKRG